MATTFPLLIRNAELQTGRPADIRVAGGRIVEIGMLWANEGERVIDAAGGLLIPGLHDHHLHLTATAAARQSVRCGPPDVTDAQGLIHVLAKHGVDWLRGIGYHESVAGMLERRWLDSVAPDRPVRIQHRSGRMWFLNSMGLDRLLASGLPPPPGLDQERGQLFDGDSWLRHAIGGDRPAIEHLGAAMARLGVTGVTDMGPANGPDEHGFFAARQADGTFSQRLMLAGTAQLSDLSYGKRLMLGPVKLHLHEAALPPYDEAVALIAAAHEQGRGAAIHCVTLTELVFALAALREVGAHPADRVEHASIAPDAQIEDMAALGVAVAVQPLFVFERGDAYRRDIAHAEWPLLYRLRAFVEAGVSMSGSSDAPYVDVDPWAAMASAVKRRTRDGETLGAAEALTPEQALGLYLADPQDLRSHRMIEQGMSADLCLLDRPWSKVRAALSGDHVRLTCIDGRVVHDRDGSLAGWP